MNIHITLPVQSNNWLGPNHKKGPSNPLREESASLYYHTYQPVIPDE